MKYSVYSGDPKIIIDENGADLVFKGGNPVMDRGIENAAIISLFTDPEWCGNGVLDEEQRIGSNFETTTKQAITRSALVDMARAAESDLSWMMEAQLAADVSAVVSAPKSNRIDATVTIVPPSRNGVIMLQLRHGINWVFQAIDPAYERVE